MDAALLNRIVQVISVAHSGTASIEERRAEVALFDELRNLSQIQVAIQVAVALTTGTHGYDVAGSGGNEYVSSQLTLMGYGVLQHVAGNRWDELSAGERDSMVGLCFSLLEGLCGGGAGGSAQPLHQQQSQSALMFALRSKCAVLFAIVIKRHGAAYASESVKRLIADEVAYASMPHAKSTYQATVSLIFRYLVDEVYQFAGDMAGTHARDMLVCMATWFPEILRFTVNALENNFKAYGEEQDAFVKKNAMFAVKTALESGALFGEVAPAGAMYASGFVKAAGYFLSLSDGSGVQNSQDLADIKSSSCEILKNVGSRRKTSDENQDDFSRAMQEAGMFLTAVAGELLKNNPEERLSFEGEDEEFAFEVVDAMVELGKTHLQAAFPDEARRFAFLEHMLAFAKHSYMPLASRSLSLWHKLLQESAASASSGNHVSVLPSEAVLFLMQLAAEQLQQRSCKVPQLDDEVPLFFDDFEEFREFISGYRLKLSGIVRYSAATLPDQALQTTVSRLMEAIAQAKTADRIAPGSATQSETMEAARGSFEAAAVFSDSTVRAVWDAVNAKNVSEDAKAARKHAFCASLEPVYLATIQLRVGDSKLLLGQAKALSSFSRLITLRPELAKDAYSNIQDMLINCIPLKQGENEVPPPLPCEPWREAAQARTAVASVFLDYAKVCQEGFLSLLEDIAGSVTQLYEAGRIRPGERNVLVEGVLVAAEAGSPQLQETVIDWSLQLTKASWSSAAVQESIASSENFVKAYFPTRMEGSEVRIGGAKERYRMNHELHQVERALRRLTSDSSRQVLGKHMVWIVPMALQLLTCFNALRTPHGRELLGPSVGILDLSQQEKAHYLRRVGTRLAPVPGDANAGDYSSVGGETVSSARGWLRHCIEYISHSLGLITSVVPGCLAAIPGLNEAGSLIYSHLEEMDHRVLRILIRHLTIPAVRDCPVEHIPTWVLPSLSILAPHMKARLATAWQSLNLSALGQDGYSHMNAHGYAQGAGQINDEDVINDRLVRELSGEYADLLKSVADRQSQVPLLQNFFVADPQGGLALAQAALEGMRRPDESAHRFAAFCKALVKLAPADAALYQFVGSELLYTSISSLSLEVMACHHSEILGMIRDIIMQQVDDPQSQVHHVLPMLPGVGPENLTAFIATIKSKRSDKEQRNQVKLFLLSSGGTGAFTALEKWKPPGGASTVQGVKKRPARVPKSQAEIDADDHLSGEITRHLLEST